MKIYVAARFHEKERVRDIYRRLVQAGHTITADWTVHKDISPYDQHPDMAGDYAREDISAVCNADVFILLTNEIIGSGSNTEIGAALAMFLNYGTPHIYVVGPHFSQNFAYFHPGVTRCNSIEEVLENLNKLGEI